MLGVSNKTKLECVRIRIINESDRAKALADKFAYEKDKSKELYWLGRHDALIFLLGYVDQVIEA